MKITVVGAGGLARVVAEMILPGAEHELVGFVDDAAAAPSELLGLPVLGTCEELPKLITAGLVEGAVIAIGNTQARLQFGQAARDAGLALPAIVAPSAAVAPSAKLAEGVIVSAQAVIGPAVTIGPLTIINTAAVIEHDAAIDEGCYIGPTCLVGARARIGTGVSIQGGQVVAQDEAVT